MTPYPWVSGFCSFKDRVTSLLNELCFYIVNLKDEYDTFHGKAGNYLLSDAASKPRKTVPDCVAVKTSELLIYNYLPLNREGGGDALKCFGYMP